MKQQMVKIHNRYAFKSVYIGFVCFHQLFIDESDVRRNVCQKIY